jgi:hypothetical protein
MAAPSNRSELIDGITRLSQRINDDIWSSRATDNQLQQAYQNLLLAAKLVRSRGNGGGNSECTEYAFSIYDRFYFSSTALENAKKLCRNVSDIQILKYSFVELERVYSDRMALENAAKYSGRDMMGKYQLLKFIFPKFDSIYTTSMALEESYKITRNHSAYDVECFKRYYPRFDSRNSTRRAIELTSQACLSE